VIPTLAADSTLLECVESLQRQTFRDFEIVIVDNSGERRVEPMLPQDAVYTVIENERNAGFGTAINQGFRERPAEFLATLNDDAVAHPGWLAALMQAIESRGDIGMCASQVRLKDTDSLDSAAMLLCRDGSSKQRGHGEPASAYSRRQEALLPSGSAAIYRRELLEETGGFDDSFFLYCEDTDLGLRARWKGWECLYVPEAIVEHRYSHSAGRASALKAFYVERNRLFLIAKNFPASLLLLAPLYSLSRYFWHFRFARQGVGAAGQFGRENQGVGALAFCVFRAYGELFRHAPRLWRERRTIQRTRRLTTRQFIRLIRRYGISPRQVAAL